jgi:hypothetical protein
MVEYWCAGWRAQHDCVLPVLIWADKLCGEELGVDGDANGALLGASAIPVLPGTWDKS